MLLRQFVDYWKQRDVPLLLVRMPLRYNYRRAMLYDPGIAANDYKLRCFVQSLTGERVRYLNFEDCKRVGLEENVHMMDYVHLYPEGAAILTSRMVAMLREMGWLSPGEGPAYAHGSMETPRPQSFLPDRSP
jgi:hypothetical protein